MQEVRLRDGVSWASVETSFRRETGSRGYRSILRRQYIVRGSASWSMRVHGVCPAKHVRDMSVTSQGVVWSEVLAFK